jgi:hypothetical protein
MRAALRYAGLGVALGAGWGVLARIWMRWVSTDHNFSWAGTLFIVGLAAVAGGSLGLVHAARRRRASRWWRVAALPTLLLFAGPGIPLLPAYVVGGWAWGSRAPAVLRAVAALPLVVLPVYFWVTADWTIHVLINPWLAIGGFYVLQAMLAAAGTVVWRRWPDRVREPSRKKVVMA